MSEVAVFGGGCFWCIEAIFSTLKGVRSVIPGYAGGQLKNPRYEDIVGGTTGHAEVVKIIYNPEKITYHDLLSVFFTIHDPTTMDRQGNDIGNQYRSIILYTSKDQKNEAEMCIAYKRDKEGLDIVTKIEPLHEFYPAENNHIEYYKNNLNNTYCRFVIRPKLEKFKLEYKRFLPV
jgi:peptide-methionine (S)-S-oxide reductase